VQDILFDTFQHSPTPSSRFGFTLTTVAENFYGAGLHCNDVRLDLPVNPEDRKALQKIFLPS
jgi:hypothetical protein